MSKQFPGGIISKTPVIPSGPYLDSTASGIWTLDQQAYWQSQGLWPNANNPPIDPQFNYVTMLLHGDGTNGAQNNTFLDSSASPLTVTRNGNTTQGSFSPYGSNWSNFFGTANGNALLFTELTLSSDFTIETWIYPTAQSSSGYTITFSASSSAEQIMYYYTDGRIGCYFQNGANGLSSAGKLSMNVWSHVAVVRSGSTVKIYVNGVDTGVSISGSSTVTVGTISGYTTGSGYNVYGYLSNVRIGTTAVYTSNFTPPTAPLTAITGTLLLTCQSNRYVDNSTSARAITTFGTPSVQRFNPFGASAAYSTSVIGGSGYFDGSGDNLSVAANSSNIGTGDFNITFWLYFPTEPLNGVPATNAYNGTAFTDGWYFYTGVGTDIAFGVGSAGGADGVSGSVNGINSWHYVEATRSGSTLSLYLDGVLAQSKSNTKTGTVSGNITRIGARYDGGGNAIAQYITDFKVVVGTAGNTSNYTPPTAPASATGATLLLSMKNAGIFDNAMMNDLETVGNAQISTSVVKYGTGSLAFDGTGDYLKIPYSPNLQFGTGAYTFEFWLNTSSVSQWLVFNAETDTGIRFYVQSDGTLELDEQVANVDHNIYSTATVNDGAWHHIALSRASGAGTKMFVDGVYQSQQAAVYNFSNASPYYIGVRSSLSGYLTGYIDDLRITKGYARYTANFTPPTAAFFNYGPT